MRSIISKGNIEGFSFSLFHRRKKEQDKAKDKWLCKNTQKQCGEEAQKETIRLTHPLFVRLASYRFPDFVEKVGRTSGKILATRLLKPEKTTGVLRNVLIICSGSYYQGSADQESFMTEWKPFVASIKQRVNSGKRSFCGYWTFPVYGNTMQRYEEQTFTTLFCTLKSDFMDVKRFEF